MGAVRQLVASLKDLQITEREGPSLETITIEKVLRWMWDKDVSDGIQPPDHTPGFMKGASLTEQFQAFFIIKHTRTTINGLLKAIVKGTQCIKRVYGCMLNCDVGNVVVWTSDQYVDLWEHSEHRWVDVGRPLQDVTDSNFLTHEWGIKWPAIGVFQFGFSDGLIKSITHRRSGDKVILEHAIETSFITFQHLWNESKASIQKGYTTTYIKTFFNRQGELPFSKGAYIHGWPGKVENEDAIGDSRMPRHKPTSPLMRGSQPVGNQITGTSASSWHSSVYSMKRGADENESLDAEVTKARRRCFEVD